MTQDNYKTAIIFKVTGTIALLALPLSLFWEPFIGVALIAMVVLAVEVIWWTL
jgi:hypothetical protein